VRRRAAGAFQEVQLIVPPAGPGERQPRVGADRPFGWMLRDAVRLGALTGRVVLICRVLTAAAWH